MATQSYFKFLQPVRNWFLNLPIAKKLRLLSRLFLAFLIIFIGFSLIAIEVIASLHGNIQAEAIFSKNQKVALYELMMFARTEDEKFYRRYEQSIRLPVIASGLRKVLVSEEKHFNLEYLRGVQESIAGSSASRVARMTPIVRMFRNTDVVQRSAAIWVKADQHLLEIISLAVRLKELIDAGQVNEQERVRLLLEMDKANQAIDGLEAEYSEISIKLSSAVNRYLLTTLFYLTVIFLMIGVLLTYLIERRIRGGLLGLLQAGRQLLQGNLHTRLDVDGGDEVGRLAFAYDKMGDSLLMARTNYTLQNEQLVKEYADLANAQSQNEGFLTKMSYDVRTPMTSVLGVVELLQDTRMSHEQAHYLHNIKTSTEVLLSVMDDIVDMSRISSGDLGLKEEQIELHRWFEETCSQLVAEEKEVELGIAGELHPYLAPGLPFSVQSDSYRLGQLIRGFWLAILENEPHIDVGLALVPEEINEQHAVLRVEFILIDAELDADTLIGVFSNESTTENLGIQGGHGLGLALSKRLVRLLNGQCGGEKTAHGIRLWFTMQLPHPKLQEVGLGEALRGVRVMYVGVDSIERWVVNHYLTDWGLVLQEVSSSADAIENLTQQVEQGHPYELLILGTKITGDDGLSLSQSVKISPRLSKVSCIIVGEVEPELAQESGISASISWPVRRRKLFEALLHAAQIKQATRVTQEWDANQFRFSGRVLLAEDNEVNSQVAKSMLRKLGFDVDVVVDGELAAEAVKSSEYNLILMDCQMPNVDGMQASKRIRQWEQETGKERNLIIAMTAESGDDAKQRCLDSGMDDYLMKPVKRRVLAEVVAQWLPYQTESSEKQQQLNARTYQADEMLNIDALRELQELAPDSFTELIQNYLTDTSSTLDELGDAFDHQQPNIVSARAHSLKSSSMYVGANQIARLATELEHASLDEAGQIIEKLEQTFVATRAAYSQYLRRDDS